MARPSEEQWKKLLDLIANDRELLFGQFTAPGGVGRTRMKWEEISEQVNDVAGATVRKDGEQWRVTWVGLRSRARASLRCMAAYRNGTGGGPNVNIAGLNLSALHKRVLALTGITAAVGTACPEPLRIQLQMKRKTQKADADPVEQQDNGLLIPNADDLLDQFANGIISHDAAAAANVVEPQMFDEAITGAVAVSPLLRDSSDLKRESLMPALVDDVVDLTEDADDGDAEAAPLDYDIKTEVSSPLLRDTTDFKELKMLHTPPTDSGMTPMRKSIHIQPEVLQLLKENLQALNEVFMQVVMLFHK